MLQKLQSLTSPLLWTRKRGTPTGTRVHEETAFRHLLLLERRRAERARRPIHLLLISLRRETGQEQAFTHAAAAAVFAGLTGCLRDVDIIGWYRTGLVAAAVLTHGSDEAAFGVSTQIGERVTRALRSSLSPQAGDRLHVAVRPLGDEPRC